MGSSGSLTRLNMPHRYQMGWLSSASTVLNPSTRRITIKSGSVLKASDTAVGLVRAVRGGVTYWLSLRTRPSATQSYDAGLMPTWANVYVSVLRTHVSNMSFVQRTSCSDTLVCH